MSTDITITLTADEAIDCQHALANYVQKMRAYRRELIEAGKTDEADKIYRYNIEHQAKTADRLKGILQEHYPYLF